ncbi:MFS transporter [Providencia stuartii]|nr:MFS transporter [Providencia stuartii]
MKAEKIQYIIFLLAISAGLAVANIYYTQPILPLLMLDFNAGYEQIGIIPMVTQLGYAVGILFLLPLGDKYNRRHLILTKGIILSVALGLISVNHSINSLIAFSFIIGVFSTIAQDIVPIAAIISPGNKQGKYVGTVMTGLLLGILLSRTISGLFGEFLNWNLLFVFSSVIMLVINIILWVNLPNFPANNKLHYFSLLSSLKLLWVRYDAVRKSVISQASLSISFSIFWSTLALYLSDSYNFSSSVVGLFGLAGAIGAIAAPVAGSLSDKWGTKTVAQISALLVIGSFSMMLLIPYANDVWKMALIVLCVIGFDLGVQASLVSNQSMIYQLDPTARGRLNAILFTGVFIGMAIGSWLGNWVYLHFHWKGVTLFAMFFGGVSVLINRLRVN